MRIVVAALAFIAFTLTTVRAQACAELGPAVTDHTCFHSRFGPFLEVVASPGTSVAAATPNVDPVHTHYRVALTPGVSGVVTYRPARSGPWAVYRQYEVPLTVRTPTGTVVPVLFMDQVPTCPFLAKVEIVSLVANTRYAFVFGPGAATSSALVIENVDDFVVVQGRDADADGYGSATDTVESACVPPAGYVANDSDCDDTNASVHPAAIEVCDGFDDDCDGVADDIGATCSSGAGACRAHGIGACGSPGGTATCGAMPLDSASAEICNGADDDCDGTSDEGSDDLCSDPSRPACVSNGPARFCGCDDDSDCGDSESGRVCHLHATEQQCADGCIGVAGRNGCPAGLVCTSLDPATIGGCVPPELDAGVDAANDGGTTRDAGAIGVPPAPGCACSTGGRGSRSLCFAAVLAVLLVLARRTRALRWVVRFAGLSLLGACAASTTVDSDAGHGAHLDAGCTPELGAELVTHSCQHAELGPFEEVVAVSGAEKSPDVSDDFHTYRVDLSLGRRVSYRATHDGAHAFFTDPPLELRIRDPDALIVATTTVPDIACDHLSQSDVAELQMLERYEIELVDPFAASATLFIEHLGAFGDEAWVTRCE